MTDKERQLQFPYHIPPIEKINKEDHLFFTDTILKSAKKIQDNLKKDSEIYKKQYMTLENEIEMIKNTALSLPNNDALLAYCDLIIYCFNDKRFTASMLEWLILRGMQFLVCEILYIKNKLIKKGMAE